MKTISTMGLLALLVAVPLGLKAGEQTSSMNNEQSCTGTLTALNPQDNTMAVRPPLWFARTFHIGQKCAVSSLDKSSAVLSDLRPGEKVEIRYQNVQGVLVADRITERALRYDGTVRDVNQKDGTVTMAQAPLYAPFRAPQVFHTAANCGIVMPDGRSGALAQLNSGDRITVLYDLPGSSSVAYRITDRSLTAVAVVDSIDPTDRTLQAKEKTGDVRFDLANDCQILLKGEGEKPGELKDLALGQPYKLTYERVNGVDVLERIAPPGATQTASRN